MAITFALFPASVLFLSRSSVISSNVRLRESPPFCPASYLCYGVVSSLISSSPSNSLPPQPSLLRCRHPFSECHLTFQPLHEGSWLRNSLMPSLYIYRSPKKCFPLPRGSTPLFFPLPPIERCFLRENNGFLDGFTGKCRILEALAFEFPLPPSPLEAYELKIFLEFSDPLFPQTLTVTARPHLLSCLRSAASQLDVSFFLRLRFWPGCLIWQPPLSLFFFGFPSP